MSSLLGQRTDQSNDPTVGQSGRSIRNIDKDNVPARKSAGGKSRTLSNLGSIASKRGNRKLSRQQVSGNQMVLQRHKRRTLTKGKVQKQRTQQLQKKQRLQQSQQKQEASAQQQEQENLGDYTMDRVMQDLQILEQQQRDAKRKLVSAQTNKQKLLDQMRKLNTLLENKNFANGALRAKLQQSHDFLAIATRDLGNRKLATDRLKEGIADFEGKLKRGLRSAQMVQVCTTKIDSFLMVIEHKVNIMRRLRMERTQKSTEIRQKYEQTEKKDQELRLAVQDTHKNIRKLGNEKVTLRNQIKDLDNDKMIAHNAEQMTLLQIQSAKEKIRVEADRFSSSKRKINSEIGKTANVEGTVSSEIRIGSTTLETLQQKVRGFEEKIAECSKKEGHSQSNDATPSFDQELFREDIRRIEEERKDEEDELLSLKKAIEDAELACKESNKRTLQNDADASGLVSTAKSITEEEQKRKQLVLDFQVSLKLAQGEVSHLEKSFQEMTTTRHLEAQANLKAIANIEDDIVQQTKVAEELKMKLKLEETSLKTQARLFDDTEKLPLLRKLEESKKKTLREQKKYNDLVDISAESSIESKLQAEFQLKFDKQTKKWEAKHESVLFTCEENLRNFPRLQEIDYTFIIGEDREEQIRVALEDLERDFTARKIAAKKSRERGADAKTKRRSNLESKRGKPKESEESKSQLHRHHYRKESNDRVANATRAVQDAGGIELSNAAGDAFTSKPNAKSSKRNGTTGRRQRRRRKGSDFFNPRNEGDDNMDYELTPTNPKRLLSSFLSQSSGQRVKWADSDFGDNERRIDFSDGVKGNSEPQTQERNLSASLDHNLKRKTIGNTTSSSTRKPKNPFAKKGGSYTSDHGVDSTATKRQSAEGPGRTRDRERGRSGSKTNRKPTNETNISESQAFAKDMSSDLERAASGSSNTIRKGESSRLSSSSRDSGDRSRGKKNRRKRTGSESREKIRRSNNEEGTIVSQTKEAKHTQKHQTSTRDMKKIQAQKSEEGILGAGHKGKGDTFDSLPSEKKRYSKAPKNSHEGAKSNTGNRSKRNSGKGADLNTKKRSFFADVDDDTFSLQVESNSSSNRDKRAKNVGRAKSRSGRPESATKQGLLKRSNEKSLLENSTGKSRSSSGRSRGQEFEGKVREVSKSGISKREKKTKKSGSYSSLTVIDNRGETVVEKSFTKSQKKTLGAGVGKQPVKSGREKARNEIRETESLGGKSTASRGSSKSKGLSSSKGKAVQKKRKMDSDNVSISSSKATVTARRRKKRNIGLSQKSTVTDIGDKSCDYNFQ